MGFNILGIVDFNILDKANVGFNFLGKEDFWQNLICVVLGGVSVKKITLYKNKYKSGGEQSVEAGCGSTEQEQGKMGEHDKQNAGLFFHCLAICVVFPNFPLSCYM